MSKLFIRAKEIYKKEGLVSLSKKVLLTPLSWLSFESNDFYLQESIPVEQNEVDFLPRIANVFFKMIFKSSELDELIEAGFDLSLLNNTQAKQRLDKGAILSLVFIKKELAYRGWLAMTRQAKDTFNDYPYKVDFLNNEACSGDVWTNPKFRRLGLLKYAAFIRRKFLRENGVTKVHTIFLTQNIAAQKAGAQRPGSITYARARYIRIFGLKFWKETPIS